MRPLGFTLALAVVLAVGWFAPTSLADDCPPNKCCTCAGGLCVEVLDPSNEQGWGTCDQVTVCTELDDGTLVCIFTCDLSDMCLLA